MSLINQEGRILLSSASNALFNIKQGINLTEHDLKSLGELQEKIDNYLRITK